MREVKKSLLLTSFEQANGQMGYKSLVIERKPEADKSLTTTDGVKLDWNVTNSTSSNADLGDQTILVDTSKNIEAKIMDLTFASNKHNTKDDMDANLTNDATNIRHKDELRHEFCRRQGGNLDYLSDAMENTTPIAYCSQLENRVSIDSQIDDSRRNIDDNLSRVAGCSSSANLGAPSSSRPSSYFDLLHLDHYPTTSLSCTCLNGRQSEPNLCQANNHSCASKHRLQLLAEASNDSNQDPFYSCNCCCYSNTKIEHDCQWCQAKKSHSIEGGLMASCNLQGLQETHNTSHDRDEHQAHSRHRTRPGTENCCVCCCGMSLPSRHLEHSSMSEQNSRAQWLLVVGSGLPLVTVLSPDSTGF